jgi:hypothetical protein
MRVSIQALEWVGIAPKGTCTVTEELLIGNDAFAAGGEKGYIHSDAFDSSEEVIVKITR